MYERDQATAYPFGLHISRVINVKIIVDKVYPCLPVWDATKKKVFKLYYNEEMPSRKMKIEIVNHPWNWSSLFNRKRLVHAPDANDVRIFWN